MNNMPINQKLLDIQYRSFYYENTLCTPIMQLYLHFDDQRWYELTIEDGVSSMQHCNKPLSEKIPDMDECYFPVHQLTTVDITDFGRLTSIDEFLLKDLEDESCGYCFNFDNNTSLRIIENGEEITINSSEEKELISHCRKVPVMEKV